MNNILVYRHRTLDTHEVFYVGIGSKKDPNLNIEVVFGIM